VVTSIFLAIYQLNLGAEGVRSWTVSLGWIVVGLAIYFAFFHREAVRRAPKVITPREAVTEPRPAAYRVLVPVYNPENVETLVGVACRMARPWGDEGEVVAVSIVEVPVQLDIGEGLKYVPQREAVLKLARKVGEEHGVRLRSEIRVAHRTDQAILQMAKQEKAAAIILGWRGFSGRRDTVFGSVVDVIIEHAPCDLLVIKFDPQLRVPFDRILLPTAGGPSAGFAARIAGTLLNEGGELTLAGVARRGDNQSEARAREGVAATIAEIPFEVNAGRKLLTGKSVPVAVIKEAVEGDYDVVLVGASKIATFKKAMFGEIPERIARYSKTPVVLVKHYEGAKTWVNRFLGS
jgi:nucleotide-binding universal stress UspA family protein